jgi:hypothetical protein
MSRQPHSTTKSDASLPRWIIWTRRILVAAGTALMVNAAIGLPSNLTITEEQHHYLKFIVLAFLLTLAAVLPVVLAIGRLLRRYVPAGLRPVLQGTSFVSAIVAIVALPVLTGNGRAADLPSALPRDYAHGLAIALGLIWFSALVLTVARTARRRQDKDASP